MNSTPSPESFSTPESPQQGAFLTTQWSLVAAAANHDTTGAQTALERLCRAYWPPLYAYVRRRGYKFEDAQDLTQEFFARLLEKRWLDCADEAKGRFRTFLLTAMERFLANEWDKRRAEKRGGGQAPVPIQLDSAEPRFGINPMDTRTPQQAFEVIWAQTLLGEVLNRLEQEYRSRGQECMFAALKPCLVGGSGEQPYAFLAERLKMSEGAVKVTVHRLRQRYRELLRAEVGETLASPEEVDAEMKYLLGVLVGGGGT